MVNIVVLTVFTTLHLTYTGASFPGIDCDVATASREQCGYDGIPEVQCTEWRRCCWDAGLSTCYKAKADAAYKSCMGYGDPHYITYDGNHYSYQGQCNYLFTKPCNDTISQQLGNTHFNVVVKNKGASGSTVSRMRYAIVNLYFDPASPRRIILGPYPGEIRICPSSDANWDTVADCPKYTAPIENEPNLPGLAITMHDTWIVLRTDFNMTVYVRKGSIEVFLPTTYANKVCGLCGDMDGNSADDTMVDGATGKQQPRRSAYTNETVLDQTEYGNSHLIVNDKYNYWERCESVISDAGCTAAQISTYTGTCQILNITDTSSPFYDCLQAFEVKNGAGSSTSLVDDCAFDACSTNDAQASLCETLETIAYTTCILELNVAVGNWTNDAGCTSQCPGNSTYTASNSACDNRCGNLTAADDCTEGKYMRCVCDTGFVKAGLKCVASNECGCMGPHGYMDRNTFVLDGRCTTKVECMSDGTKVTNSSYSCPVGQACERQNGEDNCVPAFTTNTNPDNCSPDPCKNGGTCNDGYESFNCTCTPDFTAKTCECRPPPTWTSSVPAPNNILEICEMKLVATNDLPTNYKDGVPLMTSVDDTLTTSSSSMTCITNPSSCVFSTGFTLAMWVRNDKKTYFNHLITSNTTFTINYPDTEYLSIRNLNHAFYVEIYTNAGRFFVFSSGNSSANWMHVAITVNSANLIIYLDGVQKSTGSKNTDPENMKPVSTNNDIIVSLPFRTNGYTGPLENQIGNVYQWNSVLTAAQIGDLYTLGESAV